MSIEPGNLRTTLEIETAAKVVHYNGAPMVPEVDDALFCLDVTVTATRDRLGHLYDVRAEYAGEEIALTEADMSRAVDKLADAEIEFTEPDMDGLSIMSWRM